MRERRSALLASAQYRAERQVEVLAPSTGSSRSSARSSGWTWAGARSPRGPSFARTIRSSREAPSGPERNASRGLAAYDIDDADSFFGRERDVSPASRSCAGAAPRPWSAPSGGGNRHSSSSVAAALRRGTSGSSWLRRGLPPCSRCATRLPLRRVRCYSSTSTRKSSPSATTTRTSRLHRLPSMSRPRGSRSCWPCARITSPRSLLIAVRTIARTQHAPAGRHDRGGPQPRASSHRSAGGLWSAGPGRPHRRRGGRHLRRLPMLSHASRRPEHREGNTLTVAAYAGQEASRRGRQSAEEVYASRFGHDTCCATSSCGW